MIKLSSFLPHQHLGDLQPYLDFVFLEPMSQPSYKEFYRNYKHQHETFFDNGLIELGKALNCQDFSDYINSCLPQGSVTSLRIASPDRLGDWEYNKYHAIAMARHFPREFIFVTLAGPSPVNFWFQAHWVRRKRFAGICLPYRRNRVALNINNLPTHLFGYRSSEFYPDYKGDTSIDTTEPINCAIRGWDYAQNDIASFPRHPRYFDHLMSSFEIKTAIRNIDFLRRKLAS